MKKLLLTFVLTGATVGATEEQIKQKSVWANHKKKIIAGLVITTTAIACVCDQYFNEGKITNPIKNKAVEFVVNSRDWLKSLKTKNDAVADESEIESIVCYRKKQVKKMTHDLEITNEEIFAKQRTITKPLTVIERIDNTEQKGIELIEEIMAEVPEIPANYGTVEYHQEIVNADFTQ